MAVWDLVKRNEKFRTKIKKRNKGESDPDGLGFLSEFRQHNMDLFDLWFESIQPWTKAPSSNGRLIWLRITGVPLKAWSVRCFEKIGESVGEVIRIHEDTRNRAILSEGRVLVVSSEASKISKSITLKVNEQQFEGGVVEEEWRTDPD
ncbi:hypothetical protein SLE2022_249190 [Rubroshorea leprosula]